MKSRRYRQAGLVVVVGLALLASVSCGSAVREGRGSSYVVIDALLAASGSSTTYEHTLESDVLTKNSIMEDKGKLSAHIALKDASMDPASASPANMITLERYRVAYTRSDGRNTQGVDVPYTFDGGATGTLSTQSSDITFVLVRPQAKVEAPLLALRGGGGALLISTIADVTFYGHDQAGNEVNVSGKISVNFADWADPDDAKK
jgi:hypothetical protein